MAKRRKPPRDTECVHSGSAEASTWDHIPLRERAGTHAARLCFGLAHTDEVDDFLLLRQAQQAIELAVEEAADRHRAEAERRRHQVEVLPNVAGIEPDITVATLPVFPHRPVEDGGE